MVIAGIQPLISSFFMVASWADGSTLITTPRKEYSTAGFDAGL
jgi:hypothetical protein